MITKFHGLRDLAVNHTKIDPALIKFISRYRKQSKSLTTIDKLIITQDNFRQR